MLKLLFDRDTNKCFDKDITEYLDKYYNKHINPSSLTSTKTRASTSTKPSTLRSTSFNSYLRCIPCITPMPSSHYPNTASTQQLPRPHPYSSNQR